MILEEQIIFNSQQIILYSLQMEQVHLLLQANATVTICHSQTNNLPEIVKHADIVVGAVGVPELIKAEWIKDGAIVVDAGYHPGGVGDIELEPLMERAGAITPVPGGVGPMTINTLIFQTVQAGERKLGI